MPPGFTSNHRSRWLASGIVGALAGAGAMYAFNRQPSPIRAEQPVVTVVAPPVAPAKEATPSVERLQKRVAPISPAPADESPTPEAAPAAPVAPKVSSKAPASSTPVPGKINVNTASAAELELLPGVGPVMAKAIIDCRQKNGPFKSVVDLDRVKGIGARTLERLAPLVTVDLPLPSR